MRRARVSVGASGLILLAACGPLRDEAHDGDPALGAASLPPAATVYEVPNEPATPVDAAPAQVEELPDEEPAAETEADPADG